MKTYLIFSAADGRFLRKVQCLPEYIDMQYNKETEVIEEESPHLAG